MKAQNTLVILIALTATSAAHAEISGSGHRVEGCDGVIDSFVWNDANGNGVQDAGEPPLVGVGLNLLRTDDPELGEDTLYTDASGHARFFNLCLDTHTVRVLPATLPPGMERTLLNAGQEERAPLDSDAAPGFDAVEVELDDDFMYEETVDFGFHRPGCSGSIGDRVWLDENANGLQDAFEGGLANAEVRLFDSGGQIVDRAVSDKQGRYRFAGVCDGSYQIDVNATSLPLAAAPAGQGDDPAADSDASDGTALLVAADATDTVDFGFYNAGCTSSLAGQVFADADGDGAAGAGESGIAGVTVAITDAADQSVARVTVTDSAGDYRVGGLCGGDYAVHIDAASLPGDATPSFDDSQPIGASVPANDVQITVPQAGYVLHCAASIGDLVWIDTNADGAQDADELGLESVRVEVRDALGVVIGQRVTDVAGAYSFDNLCAGDYIVQIDATSVPTTMAPTAANQGNPATDSQGAAPVWVTLTSDTVTHETTDYGFVSGQCTLRFTSSCGAMSYSASNFECKKPVESLSMVWRGAQPVRIVAYEGDNEEDVIADIDNIQVGDTVTVDGYEDSPKDVVWELYAAGTNSLLGESWFHLECGDKDMDGPEDCGLPQGDGKDGNHCDGQCITDWRLAGVIDKKGRLECAPEVAATDAACDVTLGKWVSVRHELWNVGGAGALNVQIEDDLAPDLRDTPTAVLPSGEAIVYSRAQLVDGSFADEATATGNDGLNACGDSARTTVVATPVPACAVYGVPKLEKSKNKIKWRLYNEGTQDLHVSKFSVEWHSEHGNIKEIKLGDKIVDYEVPPAVAFFSDDDMVSDRNKRKFKHDKHEDFEVKFKRDSEDRADIDYRVTIDFEEGCTVSFDASGN